MNRCAHLVEPGRIEINTVPVPTPGPGQVLLRIERALAGGTDRKAFTRGHPQIPMPGPFGHRYTGRVVRVGKGGPKLEVGQPVLGVHSAPCAVCALCRKDRAHLCPDVMKEKVLGAFGQYLCVPAPVARQNLYPRPESLPLNHAAMLEPLACAVHGLELLDWRGVERVLILGLGSMGLLFAQLLPHYTDASLFGVGRRSSRVKLGRRLGLDSVVDVTSVPLREQWHPGEQFDCVLECTGRMEGWEEAFARTAPGGQVLLFGGVPRGTTFNADSYRLHYEEVRVVGSFHFHPRDVVQAREHLLAGELELETLITDCVSLDQLQGTLEKLGRSEGLQYAVDPWS